MAHLVGVTDSELSKALIRGLPNRLKWHVVSFNPASLSDTIQRILLGEATLAMEGSELGTTECHTLEDSISSVELLALLSFIIIFNIYNTKGSRTIPLPIIHPN